MTLQSCRPTQTPTIKSITPTSHKINMEDIMFVAITGSAIYSPATAADVDVWHDPDTAPDVARALAVEWATRRGLGHLPVDVHTCSEIPAVGPEDTEIDLLSGEMPRRHIATTSSAVLRRAARFGGALATPVDHHDGTPALSLIDTDRDGADAVDHYRGGGLAATRRALAKYRSAGRVLPAGPYWRAVAWLCDVATPDDVAALKARIAHTTAAGSRHSCGESAAYVLFSGGAWTGHHGDLRIPVSEDGAPLASVWEGAGEDFGGGFDLDLWWGDAPPDARTGWHRAPDAASRIVEVGEADDYPWTDIASADGIARRANEEDLLALLSDPT